MLAVNARFFALLRALAQDGVPFVTFGSAGLALAHPAVAERYALPDADVLLVGGRPAIDALARSVLAMNGALASWGEPWDPRWTDEILSGRKYLRATIDGLRLDATYESVFDGAQLLRDARWIDGVPVASEAVIWRAKRMKSQSDARSFAERFGLATPDDP